MTIKQLLAIINHPRLTESLVIPKVKQFISQNPSLVNEQGQAMQTPIIAAASKGYLQLCEDLLDMGADPSAVDIKCCNALHHAILHEQKEIALLLISKGINIHQVELLTGCQPLHFAAEKGMTEVVSKLIERNCELNHKNYDGSTACHLAISVNDIEGVKQLLLAGANPHMKNMYGLTPFAVALYKGKTDLLNWMYNNGYGLIRTTAMGSLPTSPFGVATLSKANGEVKQVTPIYNVLLQSGVGLCAKDISHEILKLYRLNENFGSFIILATENIDGKEKLKVISTVEELQKALQNKSLKINTQALAHAVVQLNNANENHIAEIRRLLPEEEVNLAVQQYDKIQEQAKADETQALQLNTIDPAKKERVSNKGGSNKEKFEIEFTGHTTLLEKQIQEIPQLLSTLTVKFKLSGREKNIDLTLINQVSAILIQKLNLMVNYAHFASNPSTKNRDTVFSGCAKMLVELWPQISSIANSLASKNHHLEALQLLEPLDSFISDLLQHYKSLMLSNHRQAYIRIIETRVSLHEHIAKSHFKLKDTDVAYQYAGKILRECSLLKPSNHNEINRELFFSKASALRLIADNYLDEGWLCDAAENFNLALENYIQSEEIDLGIIDTATKLLTHKLDPKLQLAIANNLIKYNTIIQRVHWLQSTLTKQPKNDIKDMATKVAVPAAVSAKKILLAHDLQTIQELLSPYCQIDKKSLKVTTKVKAKENHIPNLMIMIAKRSFKNITINHENSSIEFDLKQSPIQDLQSTLNSLRNILELEPRKNIEQLDKQESTDSLDSLTSKLDNDLAISHRVGERYQPPKIRQKEKTKGTPGPEYTLPQSPHKDDTDPHYGFTPLEGYGAIVPIVGGNLPKDKLFITVKNGDKFTPFQNHLRSNSECKVIAVKGTGEQGVKLWSESSSQGKQYFARLKLCGIGGEKTLRPTGSVVQTLETKEGPKKLYAISEAPTKKKENRGLR